MNERLCGGANADRGAGFYPLEPAMVAISGQSTRELSVDAANSAYEGLLVSRSICDTCTLLLLGFIPLLGRLTGSTYPEAAPLEDA